LGLHLIQFFIHTGVSDTSKTHLNRPALNPNPLIESPEVVGVDSSCSHSRGVVLVVTGAGDNPIIANAVAGAYIGVDTHFHNCIWIARDVNTKSA